MAAELTFWSWRQEDRAAYQEIISDFNKANPDVKIKFEAFEPTSYNTILSTALAGGKGPDIMQTRAYGGIEAIAKPGYLLALDKTMVPELENIPADVLAAAVAARDVGLRTVALTGRGPNPLTRVSDLHLTVPDPTTAISSSAVKVSFVMIPRSSRMLAKMIMISALVWSSQPMIPASPGCQRSTRPAR
mgnify:CR=1 FL=1